MGPYLKIRKTCSFEQKELYGNLHTHTLIERESRKRQRGERERGEREERGEKEREERTRENEYKKEQNSLSQMGK